jgi:hypothetical protein
MADILTVLIFLLVPGLVLMLIFDVTWWIAMPVASCCQVFGEMRVRPRLARALERYDEFARADEPGTGT